MKYKRIIAAVLAVNIIASSILMGGIDANASSNIAEKSTAVTEESDQDTSADDTSDSEKTETNTEDNNTASKAEEETAQTSGDESAETVSETEDSETDENQIQVMSADISLDDLSFYTDGKASIDYPEQLILLSHCDQSEIQNITIEIKATGTLDLTTTIKAGTNLSDYLKSGSVAAADYTYLGLGSDDAPFQGTIEGQTPPVKANRAIFAALSSKAVVKKSLTIGWSGDGTDAMLARTYVLQDADKEFNIPFKFNTGNGCLIGTVKADKGCEDAILKVTNEVTYANAVTVGSATGSENAGLICNTLESGNIVLDGYTFPENATVNAGNGAAGGLIGKIAGGTLTIQNVAGEVSNLTVQSTSGSAGSIVGEIADGAQIAVNGDIAITSPKVGGKYAGSFAGKATNLKCTGDKVITIKTPEVSDGTNKDSTVGGFVGDYIATKNSESLSTQIVVETPKVTTNGGVSTDSGKAGGYFGLLELQGNITYKITGDENSLKEITSEYTEGKGASYGAIAGKVTSTDKKASLILSNITADLKNGKEIYYYGGLIGEVGEKVYLQVENAQITVSDSSAQNSACGFGGITGHLSVNSVLKTTGTVKVTVSSGTIKGGGGLVGSADSGSILEVSGTTDLSEVNYEASQYVGQLVGAQDCALIYARGDGNGNGWTYIRSDFTTGSSYINDIGNYGEILRLKPDNAQDGQKGLDSKLFQINANTHEIEYGETFSLTDTEITIKSTEALALLSVAWNSHGVFSADTGITRINWKNLQSKNITFNEDVDLTGTGILGISRDSDGETEGAYTGTISGNDHTITLAIGETFGYKGITLAGTGTDGCGKIYSVDKDKYRYLGLFANANEIINKLTVSGSIYAGTVSGDIRIGSIAARKNGGGYLKSVEVTTKIILTAMAEKESYVGGFYGEASGESVDLQTGVLAQSEISIICNEKNDSRTYVGGIIGYVSYGKLKCSGVTVKGSISTNAPNYAYVGGLIGFVAFGGDGTPVEWVEIRTLGFDGFSIDASNASVACGGLLGGVWTRTGVYFMGDKDGVDSVNGNNVTKMTVIDATINAPNASVGGLAYRASGIWEIRTDGIDIQKLKINAGKDLGILVCHGEKNSVPKGGIIWDGALYLRTTQDWKTAYKIAESLELTCGGVFDELVAYTAASANAITNNDENGIISLATTNRIGVKENSSNCTTYQNRTNYGKSQPINACSRYYYDLDLYEKESKKSINGEIDTAEELMLWSCYQYAAKSIKSNFKVGDINDDVTTITGTLDMEKYSYYPVQLNTGITIKDAAITFYNEQIENAEKTANNKSTQQTTSGTLTVQSQHYMMHCGLFLNHTASTESTSISLNNVTFAGSIGKTGSESSGVLFAGAVSGSVDNTGKQNIVQMNFQNITFSGLKITDYANEEYAPLLINQIGSYTRTEIAGLSADEKYTTGTAVASSLIGNAGSDAGTQINMSFFDISLPDKKANGAEGIFTHATLLESYKYADNDTSVATYNFYKSGDWPNGKNSKYDHQVTYGKEISNSLEYTDLQKWYYDKVGYGESEGEVVTGDNIKDFSSWLPYVCTSYDAAKHAHEIRVNQRVYDIVNGCGTYGDPYVITDAGELEIIAEYMITDLPRSDWKITITQDQSEYCTGHNQDITFRYVGKVTGKEWVQVKNTGSSTEENWVTVEDGETRSSLFMKRYIANAYYDLQGSNHNLTLTDFKGLGTGTNPFRGVLTTTTDITINLEGSGTGNGLISYSYGSVVRKLTVNYRGDKKTLTYQNASSNLYPGNCFGGVIGCILGGDNIIDGVSVSLNPGWLTLDGDKKHLLQVGGYVGSVCGGGVLFRNISSDAKGLTNDMIVNGTVTEGVYSSLYVNPYVGRVLDGYAFAVTDGEDLKNTDNNYQIQNLSKLISTDSKEKCLSASGKTITIANDKGLLLLSVIVNSGAASSGSSNAYFGTKEQADWTDNTMYSFGNGEYGKVRNATYEHIGEKTQPDDFATSVKDDTSIPSTGNTPYLITAYATPDLFNMAVTSGTINGAILKFPSDGIFNMAAYGTSYQGISARYATSAVSSGSGTKAAGIVPLIQGINGNNTQITLDMKVKEYADDDYHAASAGGVLNLFSPTNTVCNVSNLTLTGKDTDTGVIIQYYTAAGVETSSADSNWAYKSNVGVGSFAGSSSGAAASARWYDARVKFINVVFHDLTVSSPASAGGLMGNTGRLSPTNRTNNMAVADIALLIQPYAVATDNGQQTAYVHNTFENCQYSKLNVLGQEAAGGFCGHIDGQVTLQTTLNVTDDTIIVGNDSNILAVADASCAGGLYGYVRRNVTINADAGTKTAKLNSVNVTAGRYIGGIIGHIYIDTNRNFKYNINKIEVSGSDAISVKITGTSSNDIYIGGLIGNASGGSTNNDIISDCTVQNAEIADEAMSNLSRSNIRSGGIAGIVTGTTTVNIKNCQVNNTAVYGSLSGGIVGSVNTDVTVTGCTVSGSDSQSVIKGRKCAAGIAGAIASSVKVGIHDSNVNNMSVTCIDDWGAGGLVGDIDWNAVPRLYFFDSQIAGCTITGPRAGGLSGDVRGYLNGSNILLKNSSIIAYSAYNGGLLIGLTGNRNLKPMSIAGISIQNTTATVNNKATTKLYGTSNNDEENVKQQSYFSFADYDGAAASTDKDLLGVSATGKTSPYVVTSPVSQLSMQDSNNATATDKYLYSDGAFWTGENGNYTVNAQKIYTDAKGKMEVADGKYTYQEMGVDDFDFDANISTYQDNQTAADVTNFPVLVLTDNTSETITNYLDILTNGGYTRANQITDTEVLVHVEASVSTYAYDDNTGKFVKASATSDVKNALEVKENADGKIAEFVKTAQYDNTMSRFTLLTVTFTEKDENSVAHTYKVQVPIIVRRMLEINFTATLSSGTNYKATNFDEIDDKAHLLESTGNPFTAYLTYTYNSDENGLYSEYGWDSYIKAGGNVTESLGKTVVFEGTVLPAGTQLSLIDRQNGDRVYYYTVGTDTTSDGSSKIRFEDFKDSSGNSYQPQSIGELMGVTATPDTNGTFIKVDVNGKPTGTDDSNAVGTVYNAPTVRIKNGDTYEYYRIRQAGENGELYNVAVDETLLSNKDQSKKDRSTVRENYYLIVTVADLAVNENLNGSVQTEVTGTIPHQVYYLTRKGKAEDTHSSTASTYQISQGYQQSLSENVQGVVKRVSANDSVMTVDVVDKITIPSGQAFQQQDELYQKFSGSLLKTITNATGATTSSTELFPDGTSGTAEFYVYRAAGTSRIYYTYKDGAWQPAQDGETKALEYPWTAGNGLMDLPLSTDGTVDNAVSLKDIRSAVLNDQQTEFYVEVKMKAKLPVKGLDVIPESTLEGDLPLNYVKLTYTAQLATAKKSLSYSTARALIPDTNIRYYRDEPVGAKLTYEADKIGQLGINLLDLESWELDVKKENVIIDTTATYDMSAIKDLENTLKSSKGIQFKLQLQNKKTDTGSEEKYDDILSLEPYIKVELRSENSGTVDVTDNGTAYTWTVQQTAYWDTDEGKLKTEGIFNGDILTQAIRLKVDIQNVEKLAHLYSNYKVVLSAEIIDANGHAVNNTNDSDNIIYTLAKINPAFVEAQ